MRRNRHESVGIRGTTHCREDTADTSSQWEKFHRFVFDNRLIETHRELSISSKSLSRILDRLLTKSIAEKMLASTQHSDISNRKCVPNEHDRLHRIGEKSTQNDDKLIKSSGRTTELMSSVEVGVRWFGNAPNNLLGFPFVRQIYLVVFQRRRIHFLCFFFRWTLVLVRTRFSLNFIIATIT